MAILSIGDVMSLAAVIDTAVHNSKVARVMPETGDIVYGTARSIGDLEGNFLSDGSDVREAWLRVTSRSGWELFWSVKVLAEEQSRGEFAAYDW